MRVLFFNEGNIGSHILGQSTLDTALRAGLQATGGVDAVFAGLGPQNRLARALAERPLPILASRGLDMRTLRWHVIQSVRARAALERELRGGGFDAVHLHTQSIALSAGGIMRRLPVALSVDTPIRDWALMPAWPHRHAPRETCPSRMLERRALRGAAVVLAWTRWARTGLEREEPRANVVEHHPGLDLERYRPVPRRARARPRVLFVGGRFHEKGGDDLLAALSQRLGRDVDLDLVTPTPPTAREGVRVHALGPGDPALLDLYQQADALCLPTYGDTNPWVLLEAMACGTPAISTTVGAIPEMLDEGRAGVVLAPGDVAGLRAALEQLLGDDARREELGRRARELCERRYDAARQFPLLVERLREISGAVRR
jgi:glycosyltransferase involved in cell wall biosynthesis